MSQDDGVKCIKKHKFMRAGRKRGKPRSFFWSQQANQVNDLHLPTSSTPQNVSPEKTENRQYGTAVGICTSFPQLLFPGNRNTAKGKGEQGDRKKRKIEWNRDGERVRDGERERKKRKIEWNRDGERE